MKRLIFILGFVLFSAPVYANDGVIKYFSTDIPTHFDGNTFGIVCIDGYKFAFMKVSGANGVSLVQVLEQKGPMTPPQPIKCKN